MSSQFASHTVTAAHDACLVVLCVLAFMSASLHTLSSFDMPYDTIVLACYRLSRSIMYAYFFLMTCRCHSFYHFARQLEVNFQVGESNPIHSSFQVAYHLAISSFGIPWKLISHSFSFLDIVFGSTSTAYRLTLRFKNLFEKLPPSTALILVS
jgi:hypothetical protein